MTSFPIRATTGATTSARPIVRALREASVTLAAAVATLLCVLAIDPEPGPAVMAVVLCLSLSRSQLDADLRGRLEAALVLPAVSVAALGVGAMLHRLPWLGACAFVAGLSVSIWLRRFGPPVRRAGTLIALPFVVILTTPYIPTMRLGPWMAAAMPVIVAELALFWVSLAHALARRFRWLAPARARRSASAQPARTAAMKPVASTRMAIQMAVALTAAFIVGFGVFHERWAWVVLTAYLVGSGNRGRLDVAYKSVLRIAGAAAGTALAWLFAVHTGAHDAGGAILILLAVFFGVWLRPLGYAWWALFVTLALSLLQGFAGTSAADVLALRLEEIVVGATIGVAAAWFVLPVRSTDVMRRRLADALAALADAFDPAKGAHDAGDFAAAVEQMENVAPAFRASRRFTRRHHAEQPADWVDEMIRCQSLARALIANRQAPGAVGQAIGAARRALRDRDGLTAALVDLRVALAESAAAADRAPPISR